jgi:hypothetical protein
VRQRFSNDVTPALKFFKTKNHGIARLRQARILSRQADQSVFASRL